MEKETSFVLGTMSLWMSQMSILIWKKLIMDICNTSRLAFKGLKDLPYRKSPKQSETIGDIVQAEPRRDEEKLEPERGCTSVVWLNFGSKKSDPDPKAVL